MALTKEDLMAIREMMQVELGPIKADLEDVKQRVTKVDLVQETVVAKNIQLLADGYSGMAERLKDLDGLIEKVDDIQDTVEVLKQITVKNK